MLEVAFDPRRPLNCGLTLAEVAGDDLDELAGHAEAQVTALLRKASDEGAGVVLTFLALKDRRWSGVSGGDRRVRTASPPVGGW